MTDRCRCSVLEADLEEAERDRDDALALLRETDSILRAVQCGAPREFLAGRFLHRLRERFPDVTR